VPFYARALVFRCRSFSSERFSVGSRYVLSDRLADHLRRVQRSLSGSSQAVVVFATLLPEVALERGRTEINVSGSGSVLVIGAGRGPLHGPWAACAPWPYEPTWFRPSCSSPVPLS